MLLLTYILEVYRICREKGRFVLKELDYSFDSLKHAKTRLYYHVVLVTKYRKPVLTGLEADVEQIFKDMDSQGKFRIVEFACDGGDHVHLLLKVRPSVSIAYVVGRLKQISQRELWTSHSGELKKFYWKKKKHMLWSDGYFCESIGHDIEIVSRYIREQA